MNTHEEKLLEAVRSMQKSVNNLEAVIVEQIGQHAVVTADTKEPELTELPQLWYVENYEKSREWYLAIKNYDETQGKFEFIGLTQRDLDYGKEANCFTKAWVTAEHIELTREQFERLKYNPWKESLKPKQFDPNTADKRKPYRAIHKSGATGNVYYAWFCERWLFTNYDNVQSYAEDCTHIDYNPIDYSDIPEYKHIE